MKFAVQDTLLQQQSYWEAFRSAKDLGFDAVELALVGKTLQQENVEAIRNASHTFNIPVSGICGGYRGWIGDFDNAKRELAIEDIKKSLKLISELGGTGLIAPAAYGMFSKKLPSPDKPRSDQEDGEVLVESLSKISETAEKYNVMLLLEPLNRYEDHMVNKVEEAAAIVDKVGSPSIKILADFYHMNIEEADISQTINDYASYIPYFHLADSNRMQPGKGHIDFDCFLTELKNNSFQGFLSLECELKGEVKSSLRETLEFLHRPLREKLKHFNT